MVVTLPYHVFDPDTFNDLAEILLSHLFKNVVNGLSPSFSGPLSDKVRHFTTWLIG